MGLAMPADLLAAYMLAAKIKEKFGVEVEVGKLADFVDDNWREALRQMRKSAEKSDG